MRPSFSIIINTYNRAHTLSLTLDSLQWLRYSKFEVIVVNGPSTDSTEEVIQPYIERIKFARCEHANLSMSRNIGIAMASGDIVCFIDDDAVPEPDWLDQLATGYHDPKIAAVGGYIRDHTGYSFQCKFVMCDRLGNGQSYETIEEARIDSGPHPFRFPSLTGTNSSFRRDALLAIGGFDEEFVYFLDETDVIVRLIDAGYSVEYIPNAEIHHKYASSHLRDTNRIPKTIYYSVRSKSYFCIRHGSPSVSLGSVMQHLEKYQSGLKRDYKWYIEHGKINAEHYSQLVDDIDRGLRDGIADAFALGQPKFLTQELRNKHASNFFAFRPKKETKQRLKICFLSQDYPPKSCGGIGKWTHELATMLASLGHEISVVTRGENHPTVDFEDGVWVHRIIPHWQPKREIPLLPDIPQIIKDYAYTAYDEVMRIHVRRGLDIVSSPIWDLEGAACIADGSIPTVLSLHSTFKLVLPTKPEWLSNLDYKTNHIDKVIGGEYWALENTAYILANSKAIIEDIESIYTIGLDKQRYSIVPHGINPVAESLLDTTRTNVVKLLFVGRFEKRKGIDLLLAALPALMSEYPQLEVSLVGDNDIVFENKLSLKNSFITKYANENWLSRINFSGVVDNGTLDAYYSACDIFVAPSRYESFGLIFLEAMRHGKACIGSRVGGIKEVIEHESTGLLCDSENYESIQIAIRRLIESPALRESLGSSGYAAFTNKFTAKIMADTVANLFTTLISRKAQT
jgi:glycogen synthase